MRHLTLTLSLILGLATSVSAEEILKCDGSLFMYKEGWVSDEIYRRVDAGWEEWCTHPSETKTIKDEGGVCEMESGQYVGKFVLDFIAKRYTYTGYGDDFDIKCEY